MGKNKILFLVNHDVVIYNFRLELIETLLRENYEVHISSPYGEKIERLKKLGCIYHETEVQRRGMNVFYDIKLLYCYYKLIKNIKPEVILTYTIKPNIYGGLVATFLKIPYLVNITGLGSGFNENVNQILKNTLILLYRLSMKKAQCIFFQNEENKFIFEKHRIFAKKTKLIPGSGVNVDRYDYKEYEDNEKINIYYFGRLMYEKGTYELLEVAKYIKAKYPKVYFHLVGFSEDAELSERINELDKKGIIIYHGYQNDTHHFLTDSHAVIQPSHHEGMSNVLLEASSSGRPVLASDIPGCNEIIEDKKTGFLFEKENNISMVKAIESFLRLSIKDRKKMGQSGREKVIKEFSREIVVKAYMEEIVNIKGA